MGAKKRGRTKVPEFFGFDFYSIFSFKNMRFFGMAFFIFGCCVILSSGYGITGQIVGEDYFFRGVAPIFGLVFIVGGMLLLVESGGLEQIANDYYKNRAFEIFNPKLAGQDVWISRWELDGLMKYLNENAESVGFEHGSNIPTIHLYARDKADKVKREQIEKRYLGIPHTDPTGILHMNVFAKMEDNYGRVHKIKRHFFITNDPYDPRLKFVGRDIQTGHKIMSEAYNPHHPRIGDQIYDRGIFIGRTDYTERK